MRTAEQSGSRARRGWPIAAVFAVGAMAGIWQFLDTREPGYLMAATGLVMSVPHAWLNPIVWRDPMDATRKPTSPLAGWNVLRRIGFVLILCGLIWVART